MVRRASRRVARAILPRVAYDAVVIVTRYRRHFGVFPNIIRPRSLNEHVLHRMIFDHRPMWTRLQDKYAVRRYVIERVGAAVLPALYWTTTDPGDIPFDTLPARFVVKASHGSGWVQLVPDKNRLVREALIAQCGEWLRRNYYHDFRERVYEPIEPRILVEEFIDDRTGLTPTDYKFLVFGGRAHVIQVDVDRFGDHRRAIYDVAWNRIHTKTRYPTPDQDVGPPPHLGDMIGVAEALGGGLDHVRVDLYDTRDKLYFGEITTTPAAGLEAWDPDFDRALGALWPHGRTPR